MRALRTRREVDDLTLLELPLAVVGAQRRRPAEDEEQLLGAVVDVEDLEVAGPELVEARPEERAATRYESLDEAAAATPVLLLLAPVVGPDVRD